MIVNKNLFSCNDLQVSNVSKKMCNKDFYSIAHFSAAGTFLRILPRMILVSAKFALQTFPLRILQSI